MHEKHLVDLEASTAAEHRYRLLETVRSYALEQLQTAGEAHAVADRQARYYLALAERSKIESQASRQTWGDRLAREHDNVRGALQFLLDSADAEAGLRLAMAMAWFWSAAPSNGKGSGGFLDCSGMPSRGPWDCCARGH